MDDQKSQEMQGKICLVTGSSRGIGFFTALKLAQQGAHVIIVSHDREHCKQAHTKIINAAGENSARFYVADLSSMSEIRQFANNFRQDYEHLDVLVNNVGGWFPNYRESEDGFEMTFVLNHLSYFLLTGLLIDLLKNRRHARIINVSSDAHKTISGINFQDLQYQNQYRAFQAYSQSKLANIMFTYELAKQLEGSGVTVNALHPGLVNSKLYRHYGILTPVINLFISIFGKSSQKGAETSIFLASSRDVNNATGKYFVDSEQKRSSPASYDKEQAKRLWEISERMTDFNYPI